MYDEGKYLSDKKLLNIMEESDITKLSDLFSNGKFDEIINTYFKKSKNQKDKAINAQTIEEFLNVDNPNNDYRDSYNNFSKSNNNLNTVNKKEKTIPDYTVTKTLTFSEGIGSFSDFDFIISTPPTNVNDILKDDNDFSNPNSKNLSLNLIDSCFNSSNDQKEFDYTLLKKCENDKLTQQILLTIVIYCLIKIKENNEVKSLFDKFNIPDEQLLFPLILLKAKFYFKNKEINKSLDIYTKAIDNYNSFKAKNEVDDEIIYVETYRQEFFYFNNLFNYLFALNNIDSKIKKLYYEQKFCLYYLNFYSKGFKLLIELYNKYPNDVQIQFELAKDSVFLSKYDIFKEMFGKLKNNMENEKDENKKLIYTNYLLYIQGISYLSMGKVEETKNSFTDILKNDSSNIVVINNNALLSVYKNKAKESLNILNLIQSPNQMNSYNESIQENINILTKKFNANLQK